MESEREKENKTGSLCERGRIGGKKNIERKAKIWSAYWKASESERTGRMPGLFELSFLFFILAALRRVLSC